MSVTVSLSRSLPFSLKSPRAAFSGACAHARCVTPPLLVRLRRMSPGALFQTALILVSSRLCPGQSLHTSTSGGTLQVKKVQKNFKNNYASVECGAKILSANSEAKVRNTHTADDVRFCNTDVQPLGKLEVLMYQLKHQSGLVICCRPLDVPLFDALTIWFLLC